MKCIFKRGELIQWNPETSSFTNSSNSIKWNWLTDSYWKMFTSTKLFSENLFRRGAECTTFNLRILWLIYLVISSQKLETLEWVSILIYNGCIWIKRVRWGTFKSHFYVLQPTWILLKKCIISYLVYVWHYSTNLLW